MKRLRLSQRRIYLIIVTAIIFTGCLPFGATRVKSPELEIQRTLDDFLILETQHIYFLTADWTITDIERIANRTYADVVTINGEPISREELLDMHREAWQVWEQLDEKAKDDLRSQLEENKFIMEFREQKIFVSTSKNRAIAQGILYGGLLLPSGEPIEEMLVPFWIELKRVNETWKIAEVTELQH